jgi:two-component system cell cycle response regulator DivK
VAGALILVVEDDARSRRLVRDVLEHAGYRIAEATAGDEGVRLARALRPALVLMDIQLPGMDGITALGLLRADPATRAIPVVAVTASAMAHDRPALRAAGFDALEQKPIGVKALVALVHRLVGGRAPGGEGPS